MLLQQRKSGNKWVQLKQKQDIAWIDIAYVLSGNQKQILSVPIHSYYKDVIPGQYRYTKAIGKEEVVVLFEIGRRKDRGNGSDNIAELINGDEGNRKLCIIKNIV